MSKLNIFIDVGNINPSTGSENYDVTQHHIVEHIALLKNMEHIESVFIYASNENKVKETVSKLTNDDFIKKEYAHANFINETASIRDKKNKIIIYCKKNDELITHLSKSDSIAKDALMIQYNDLVDLQFLLDLFIIKKPKPYRKNIGQTDNSPIQYSLYANRDDEFLKQLNDIIKDAGKLRGIKINLMNQGQEGGLFGLFKKKKWDELAEDIVKTIVKEKSMPTSANFKFLDSEKKLKMDSIENVIKKYYGLDSIQDNTSQKYYTALNNYESALTAVNSMLIEKELLDITKATPMKMSSLKKKKTDGTNKKVSELKHEMKRKISAKVKARSKVSIGNKKINKFVKTSTNEVLVICNIVDKDKFKDSDVPVIYYSKDTIPILDMLFTTQFHESKSKHNLFFNRKQKKLKEQVISGVKRFYSKKTRKNIKRERSLRSSSRKRMESKKAKEVIKDYVIESTIDNTGKKIQIDTLPAAKKAMEANLKAKKAELKRLGFALFGKAKTKKKELLAEINRINDQIAEIDIKINKTKSSQTSQSREHSSQMQITL